MQIIAQKINNFSLEFSEVLKHFEIEETSTHHLGKVELTPKRQYLF